MLDRGLDTSAEQRDVRIGDLNNGVQATPAVQHLVAHSVAPNVVAHDVFRVPVLAPEPLDVDRELGKVQEREVRLELVAELREASIRDGLGPVGTKHKTQGLQTVRANRFGRTVHLHFVPPIVDPVEVPIHMRKTS